MITYDNTLFQDFSVLFKNYIVKNQTSRLHCTVNKYRFMITQRNRNTAQAHVNTTHHRETSKNNSIQYGNFRTTICIFHQRQTVQDNTNSVALKLTDV